MSKILRQRVKILAGFLVATLIIVAIYAYQVRQSRRSVDAQIDEYKQTVSGLEKQIRFGDFTSQKVDDYIVNLNRQIRMLTTQSKISDTIIANPGYFSESELTKAGIDLSATNSQISRYKLDRQFMTEAWFFSNLVMPNTNLVDSYTYLSRSFAQLNFDFSSALQASSTDAHPRYVHAGEVIGFEGCTGVCSGSHLHFSAYLDDKLVNNCNYLPLRELSRWGVASNCGTSSDKAQLAWPLSMAWIITENFGAISSVTHTVHNAIDVIDRDLAPVMAAHDGWLITQKKSCIGANPCNKGAANVVTICQNRDCKSGWRTEYWHLDWMIE